MKEHPILFSGPMVRAILEGRKTMTRRVACPPGYNLTDYGLAHCPYGQPGDRLWVRETWDFRSWARDTVRISYGAGGLQEDRVPPPSWNPTVYNYDRWRPSIHMPRFASRITLEITAVRVERVQDISEADAEAEGVEYDQGWEEEPGFGYLDYLSKDDSYSYTNPRDSFRSLWDSINAKRGYGWDANPWVWVVEFKRIEP